MMQPHRTPGFSELVKRLGGTRIWSDVKLRTVPREWGSDGKSINDPAVDMNTVDVLSYRKATLNES